MSTDDVDDLHAAEDVAAAADPDYCRPSCMDRAERWGGCEDESQCGCPCHNRENGCTTCGQKGYRDDDS